MGKGIIRWENPPASRSGQARARKEAVERDLRSRPGEWGVYSENQKNPSVSMFRNWNIPGLECVTRSNGDGTARVFLRVLPLEKRSCPALVTQSRIRLWAKENGITVKERGAIPAKVRKLYLEALDLP